MMMPFVSLALSVSEKMEFTDKDARSIAMRFCKLYPPEKIAQIVEEAQGFSWWRQNPKAAFMKAVGVINRKDK